MEKVLKIFDGLKEEEISKLIIALEIDSYKLKRRESVFKYTRLLNSFGIVKSGKLKVIDRSTDVILEVVEENEMFGINLNSSSSFEIDIVAIEGSVVDIIDYQNIKRIDNLIFMNNLFKLSIDCLGKKNNRISVMANRNIRDKLLAYFKTIPRHKPNGEIEMPFSYTDLANYLAIDRSAMYKEIRKLEEEGFLKVNGRKLKLSI